MSEQKFNPCGRLFDDRANDGSEWLTACGPDRLCPHCQRIAELDAKLTTHESAAKRWAEYVKLEESSLTGWYWASSEYPEDGYTGSYATEAEAIEAAQECGYDDPETDTARIYVENMTTVRRELDARIADLEAKLAESEAINEILREQLAEAESPPEIRTRMGREANDDA